MEFEFKYDEMMDQYIARFEAGFELFEAWFTDELGTNLSLLEQVKNNIAKLESKQIHHWQHNGRELELILDQESANLSLNVEDDEEQVYQDELNIYRGEAQCGLEDFANAVTQWQLFVHHHS